MPSLLLVEDDHDLCEVLVHLLKGFRCRILQAESGEEALKILASEKVQFIVSDMRLPEMDGLQFLMSCRNNPKVADAQFIALTGDSALAEQAKSRGADDILLKPFQLHTFRALMSKYLGLSPQK